MTYIFLWRLSRSDLRHSLTSKWTLKPHIYISLRNISTFLLKINTFLTKKKKKCVHFLQWELGPVSPLLWPIYFFKDLQEVIWNIPPPWNRLWNLIYILKKNKYTLKKNKYILSKRNPNPNHPYYDLYISLGTLKKWFKAFPQFKMDFGTPHTFFRKISTFFTKIHTFFLRGTRTSSTLIIIYIFLWRPLQSDLKHSPTLKWDP